MKKTQSIQIIMKGMFTHQKDSMWHCAKRALPMSFLLASNEHYFVMESSDIFNEIAHTIRTQIEKGRTQ